MPEISVIVPVYKVEPYLHRCVDSILNQTFSDFELILVDDGSPDNCGAICDEYAAKDSRVVAMHQQNQGVSSARNYGVSVSIGKYITFVDSDDWIAHNFLERMYSALKRHDADVAVGYIKKTADMEGAIPVLGQHEIVFSPREALEHYFRTYDEKILGPMVKLMSRQIALENPFPTDRDYAEDLAVCYKWYYSAEKIVDLDDRLYFYFIREDSAVRKRYSAKKLANLKTLEEIIAFLKENSFDELYCIYIHRYLFDLSRQHRDVSVFIKDKSILKMLRTKMLETIKREKKHCNISPRNDPNTYNVLFPKRMKLYWFGVMLKNKLLRWR